MELTEVTDPSLAKEFIQANVRLNRSNPGYIRPMDNEIEEVFDPKRNKAFRHGELARWLLKDQDGQVIGRIAAFVNKKYKTKGDDVPVGGVGFFDCINNQAAADMAQRWGSICGHTGRDAIRADTDLARRNRSIRSRPTATQSDSLYGQSCRDSPSRHC